MKIVLISDTHGNLNGFLNVIMKNKNADIFIHLGDGAREYLKVKSIYKDIPLTIVKGNCDFMDLPLYRTFNFDGIKMYACHGDSFDVKNGLEKYINFAINSKYNIIAYGHTHKRYIQKDKNLCIINPGSLTFPREDKASYAVITIEKGAIELNIIDYP